MTLTKYNLFKDGEFIAQGTCPHLKSTVMSRFSAELIETLILDGKAQSTSATYELRRA